MTETFERVLALVEQGEVRVSDHGYGELAEHGIFVRDIIAGVRNAVAVEDYPEY